MWFGAFLPAYGEDYGTGPGWRRSYSPDPSAARMLSRCI